MYVVIPAGGSGTRLWPLSRAANPKFLHPLTGDARTLIQTTLDRLAALAPLDRTFVVTGGAHVAPIARQVPDLPCDNIIAEPSPRDSAPAIGLAAAIIHHRDPEAIMGSFHADHLVRDEESFREAVRLAARVASDGWLMTIGIEPTRPETGYGYIQRGAELAAPGSFQVAQFKEKPARDVAEAWVADGHYLWNTGMFVWKCATLLEEMERQVPDLYRGLCRIADAWDTPDREETLMAVWPTLPKVAIDTAIMEGAAARGRVGTIPAQFGWNDVGDWDTLGDILATERGANVVLGGDASRHLAIDTTGALIAPSSGRIIATLGVRDLAIIDTDDAVLVCARDRAQDVKRIVEALKALGHAVHL